MCFGERTIYIYPDGTIAPYIQYFPCHPRYNHRACHRYAIHDLGEQLVPGRPSAEPPGHPRSPRPSHRRTPSTFSQVLDYIEGARMAPASTPSRSSRTRRNSMAQEEEVVMPSTFGNFRRAFGSLGNRPRPADSASEEQRPVTRRRHNTPRVVQQTATPGPSPSPAAPMTQRPEMSRSRLPYPTADRTPQPSDFGGPASPPLTSSLPSVSRAPSIATRSSNYVTELRQPSWSRSAPMVHNPQTSGHVYTSNYPAPLIIPAAEDGLVEEQAEDDEGTGYYSLEAARAAARESARAERFRLVQEATLARQQQEAQDLQEQLRERELIETREHARQTEACRLAQHQQQQRQEEAQAQRQQQTRSAERAARESADMAAREAAEAAPQIGSSRSRPHVIRDDLDSRFSDGQASYASRAKPLRSEEKSQRDEDCQLHQGRRHDDIGQRRDRWQSRGYDSYSSAPSDRHRPSTQHIAVNAHPARHDSRTASRRPSRTISPSPTPVPTKSGRSNPPRKSFQKPSAHGQVVDGLSEPRRPPPLNLGSDTPTVPYDLEQEDAYDRYYRTQVQAPMAPLASTREPVVRNDSLPPLSQSTLSPSYMRPTVEDTEAGYPRRLSSLPRNSNLHHSFEAGHDGPFEEDSSGLTESDDDHDNHHNVVGR